MMQPFNDGARPIDVVVPVPPELSRRAWDCAFDLGQEHSATIGSDAFWHMLQTIVVHRPPEHLTWTECGLLFRAHRAARPVRA